MQPREIINPYRCLDDLKFQDDLVDFGIIRRGSLDPSRWGFSSSYRIISNSPTVKVVEILSHAPGYVSPYDRLAERVYGNSNRANVVALQSLFKQKRREASLKNPDSVLVVPELGLGLGVESFTMSPEALACMYSLWRHKGKFVNVEGVASEVHGSKSRTARLALIRTKGVLNNNYLRGSDARIEVVNFSGQNYYRLNYWEQSLPEIKLRARGFRPHLSLEFQNWLAGEPNIIEMDKNIPANIDALEVNAGSALSEPERKVLHGLFGKIKRIVPYEPLIKAAFNEAPGKPHSCNAKTY